MSPQGQQAAVLLKKMQGYTPARDTKTGSLKKFYTKQAGKFMQSGVLPESERAHFAPRFGRYMGAA